MSGTFLVYVDLKDSAKVGAYRWRVKLNRKAGKFYVRREERIADGKRREVLLHRYLMGAMESQLVDHVSGCTLDNRRSANLRVASNQQNACNSTVHRKNGNGIKGVSFLNDRNVYRAQIQFLGKKINLGDFADAKSAARAYDEAALRLFGEYSRPNRLAP